MLNLLKRDDEISIGDARWWLDHPTLLVFALYAAGFVAQNTYLAGFRFISTEVLDKNYLLTGLLCVASGLACYYLFFKPLLINASVDLDIEHACKLGSNKLQKAWKCLVNANNFCVTTIVILSATNVKASYSFFVAAIIMFSYWIEKPFLNKLLGHYVFLRSMTVIYWLADLPTMYAINGYVLAVSAFFLLLHHVVARWDRASAIPETLGVLAICCGLYGYVLHPLIRGEIGGGATNLVSVAYIDPSKKNDKSEYAYTPVIGSIVHASESMIYIRKGDELIFVKRENILSVGPVPKGVK